MFNNVLLFIRRTSPLFLSHTYSLQQQLVNKAGPQKCHRSSMSPKKSCFSQYLCCILQRKPYSSYSPLINSLIRLTTHRHSHYTKDWAQGDRYRRSCIPPTHYSCLGHITVCYTHTQFKYYLYRHHQLRPWSRTHIALLTVVWIESSQKLNKQKKTTIANIKFLQGSDAIKMNPDIDEHNDRVIKCLPINRLY